MDEPALVCDRLQFIVQRLLQLQIPQKDARHGFALENSANDVAKISVEVATKKDERSSNFHELAFGFLESDSGGQSTTLGPVS